MIRRMLESNDNIFYCAECTYDKSNGTMFLYTTDITEVRGSVKPKDSMKVEGGFLVRRKYFRSEYEAQEYIDSLPNAMPMSRNESIRRLGEGNSSLKLKKVKTGKYTTTDGKYEIEKSDGFWYAVDTKTGQSVVDCENSLSAIKDSLESYIKSHGKKESFRRLRESFDDIDGYAVNIHDMGKGYHHLLLFSNLDDAEYAYDQLDDISESDENEDEIAVDLGVIIDTCDEVVNEIDWRREIDKNDVWTAGDDTRYQIIGNVDLWIYW